MAASVFINKLKQSRGSVGPYSAVTAREFQNGLHIMEKYLGEPIYNISNNRVNADNNVFNYWRNAYTGDGSLPPRYAEDDDIFGKLQIVKPRNYEGPGHL